MCCEQRASVKQRAFVKQREPGNHVMECFCGIQRRAILMLSGWDRSQVLMLMLFVGCRCAAEQVLMIMLITLLNDGALISIGYDNVIPNKVRRISIDLSIDLSIYIIYCMCMCKYMYIVAYPAK